MPKNIVVIGGAHGGPTAAVCARSYNESAHVTLIEQGPSVSRLPADPKDRLIAESENLTRHIRESEHSLRDHYNINLRVNCEALSLDLEARCVVVKEDRQRNRIPFDRLIYAGDELSKATQIPGLTGKRVANFRNVHDVNVIKKACAAGAQKAVVLGCGRCGIQAAMALKGLGLQTTVIEKSVRILADFSFFSATQALRCLKKNGIDVVLGQEVVSAAPEGEGLALTLSSGVRLDADLVIVAIGGEARIQLLEDAGAAIQSNRCVRVDAGMLTTLPGVYACGSAVSVSQCLSHEKLWIPQLWMHERSAQIAGQNAAVDDAADRVSMGESAGTQLLEIGDMCFARTGLSESSARKYCGAFFHTTVHGRISENWHSDEDISLRLMVAAENGQVIGGEMWGAAGIVRRIDLVAVAVAERWSVERLADLEMAYAPRFGAALDPLKEAARQAVGLLKQENKQISVDTMALWMAQGKNFEWLHVGDDLADGVPTGAQTMSLDTLRQNVLSLNIANHMVITSKSGRKAKIAQQILSNHGHQNIGVLDGGLISWSLWFGKK